MSRLCEAHDGGAGSSVARKWLERRDDGRRSSCERGKAAIKSRGIEQRWQLRVDGDGAVILEVPNLQVQPFYLSVKLLFGLVHIVE